MTRLGRWLGLVAVAAPLALAGAAAGPAVGAERPARVGFLGRAGLGQLEGLRRALAERGWVEGQNLVLSHRLAADSAEFLRRAEELAGEADVIVAGSLNAARTARRATRTVPIVMWGAPDPVRWGLVASRTLPGGNVTGIEDSGPLQARGRVGLLREVLPGLVRLAVLVDPGRADHREALKEIQAAAGAAGVTVRPVEVSGPDTEVFILGQRVRGDALRRFEAGVRVLGPGGSEALIVLPRSREADLALQDLATRHRVPSLHGHAAAPVKFGGLLWLVSWPDRPRQVAGFVDRILRGARPEDLPVEDARGRLVVNLKTAKALGLTIPPSVLLRADEVIQ